MTPAPSPASSSVVPQGPAALSRPGSSPTRGPGASGALRAQAASRTDGAAAGQGRRAGAGFATVLAAVQEDGRAGSAPEATPAGDPSERVARPDTEAAGAIASEAPVHEVPVAPSDVPGAPPQTPWLLLAFGSGTIARGGSGESASDGVREPGRVEAPAGAERPDLSTDTRSGLDSGVAAVPGAMPDRMAVVPASTSVVGPPSTSSVPRDGVAAGTPPDLAPDGAVVPTVQPLLTIRAASTGESRPQDQAAPGLERIPTEGAAEQIEGVSTGRPMMATGPHRGDTPERVQAMVLGVSGSHAGAPTPTDLQAASVPGSSPATARAATLLAHALGQPGPAGDVVRADAVRPLVDEALAGVPGIGQPAVRATEALLRFAQSGVAPPRSARDPDGALPLGLVGGAAPVGPVPPDLTPSATVVDAPLPSSVGDQVLHHVVSSLRMQWKDGIGEAKLHLRPDALGAVSVSLRVEAGVVTAVVRADSPQVQEWVVQHQQTLRQQMEAAGLRLDELVVTPDDERQGDRQQDAPPEHRHRRQPAETATDAPAFEQLL